MSTFRVPRRTDQRRQVMTQWPAAIPEFGTFPAGAESGTFWVDDDDHEVKTPTAAGPITAGATAIVYGSFSPDIHIEGGGGTATYSGTATASLIDKDGAVLQTLSITGGGSKTTGNQESPPGEPPPDYPSSQSAFISNVATTGVRDTEVNGQTITNVPLSGGGYDGGYASFTNFIAAVTPGYRPEQLYKGSKCRIIPLTLAP